MLDINKLQKDACSIRKLILDLCVGKEGGHHFGGCVVERG